jgi:hypothetical protein
LYHHPHDTLVSATSPGQSFTAAIVINGIEQPLPRRSDGRAFVAGAPGSPYVIRVRNQLPVRIEVIVSIDGRYWRDDKPASPREDSGHAIAAYDSYDFEGWRVSHAGSRPFVFADLASSVVTQSGGDTRNTGVIGLAAWREEAGPVPLPATHHRHHARDGFYATSKGADWVSSSLLSLQSRSFESVSVDAGEPVAVASASIGTGMGDYRSDPVSTTQFRRTGQVDILPIGYDTYDALLRRGILQAADPDPFPGQNAYGSFPSVRS